MIASKWREDDGMRYCICRGEAGGWYAWIWGAHASPRFTKREKLIQWLQARGIKHKE